VRPNATFKPGYGSNALRLEQLAYAFGHCRDEMWPNVIFVGAAWK
jgi:hypothetical protein